MRSYSDETVLYHTAHERKNLIRVIEDDILPLLIGGATDNRNNYSGNKRRKSLLS